VNTNVNYDRTALKVQATVQLTKLSDSSGCYPFNFPSGEVKSTCLHQLHEVEAEPSWSWATSWLSFRVCSSPCPSGTSCCCGRRTRCPARPEIGQLISWQGMGKIGKWRHLNKRWYYRSRFLQDDMDFDILVLATFNGQDWDFLNLAWTGLNDNSQILSFKAVF